MLHLSILEHWHTQYDDLQLSTNDFYNTLETILEAKAFPNVSHKRELMRESGWFSSSREYLVVTRFEYNFIICGSPFGRSFFFSWYMRRESSIAEFLGYIPFIGKWLLNRMMRQTYFEYDTEVMFNDLYVLYYPNFQSDKEFSKNYQLITYCDKFVYADSVIRNHGKDILAMASNLLNFEDHTYHRKVGELGKAYERAAYQISLIRDGNKIFNIYIIVCLSVGLLFSVLGIGFWYGKIQVEQDMMLKLQTKQIQAAIDYQLAQNRLVNEQIITAKKANPA